MIKYLYNPDTFTRDCDEAIEAIYPEFVRTVPDSFNGRSLYHYPADPDKVNTIISTGGGGGPMSTAAPFAAGLSDICVNGGLYASPSAYDIYEAAKYIGSSKGYILIYNNFMGDCLNNDLALELMELDGMKGELVPFWDDCLSVEKTAPRCERTGLLGMVYGSKIASGFAVKGASLSETALSCRRVRDRVSSLIVTFDEQQQAVMLGEGISGEPARLIFHDGFSLRDAARHACEILLDDLQPSADEKLYILINRTFPTNYEDTYIFSRYVKDTAASHSPVSVISAGHFMRMSYSYGFSVTMLSAPDDLAWPLKNRSFTDSFIL